MAVLEEKAKENLKMKTDSVVEGKEGRYLSGLRWKVQEIRLIGSVEKETEGVKILAVLMKARNQVEAGVVEKAQLLMWNVAAQSGDDPELDLSQLTDSAEQFSGSRLMRVCAGGADGDAAIEAAVGVAAAAVVHGRS